MNIAIIPARAGSKRIPNKNKRDFLGKPIIEYAIESAELSCMFDHIVISTDDQEIMTKYFGRCKMVERSKDNASDTATLTQVIHETLMQLEDGGIFADNICLILPCSVFIDYDDLLLGYDDLDGNDCVFTVCKYQNHPLRVFGYKDNIFGMRLPEYANTRTQDLPDAYYDAGQFYWLDVRSFKKQNKIFMEKYSHIS
jgi:pseudaminic acid cytidylyltransferase